MTRFSDPDILLKQQPAIDVVGKGKIYSLLETSFGKKEQSKLWNEGVDVIGQIIKVTESPAYPRRLAKKHLKEAGELVKKNYEKMLAEAKALYAKGNDISGARLKLKCISSFKEYSLLENEYEKLEDTSVDYNVLTRELDEVGLTYMTDSDDPAISNDLVTTPSSTFKNYSHETLADYQERLSKIRSWVSGLKENTKSIKPSPFWRVLFFVPGVKRWFDDKSKQYNLRKKQLECFEQALNKTEEDLVVEMADRLNRFLVTIPYELFETFSDVVSDYVKKKVKTQKRMDSEKGQELHDVSTFMNDKPRDMKIFREALQKRFGRKALLRTLGARLISDNTTPAYFDRTIAYIDTLIATEPRRKKTDKKLITDLERLKRLLTCQLSNEDTKKDKKGNYKSLDRIVGRFTILGIAAQCKQARGIALLPYVIKRSLENVQARLDALENDGSIKVKDFKKKTASLSKNIELFRTYCPQDKSLEELLKNEPLQAEDYFKKLLAKEVGEEDFVIQDEPWKHYKSIAVFAPHRVQNILDDLDPYVVRFRGAEVEPTPRYAELIVFLAKMQGSLNDTNYIFRYGGKVVDHLALQSDVATFFALLERFQSFFEDAVLNYDDVCDELKEKFYGMLCNYLDRDDVAWHADFYRCLDAQQEFFKVDQTGFMLLERLEAYKARAFRDCFDKPTKETVSALIETFECEESQGCFVSLKTAKSLLGYVKEALLPEISDRRFNEIQKLRAKLLVTLLPNLESVNFLKPWLKSLLERILAFESQETSAKGVEGRLIRDVDAFVELVQDNFSSDADHHLLFSDLNVDFQSLEKPWSAKIQKILFNCAYSQESSNYLLKGLDEALKLDSQEAVNVWVQELNGIKYPESKNSLRFFKGVPRKTILRKVDTYLLSHKVSPATQALAEGLDIDEVRQSVNMVRLENLMAMPREGEESLDFWEGEYALYENLLKDKGNLQKHFGHENFQSKDGEKRSRFTQAFTQYQTVLSFSENTVYSETKSLLSALFIRQDLVSTCLFRSYSDNCVVMEQVGEGMCGEKTAIKKFESIIDPENLPTKEQIGVAHVSYKKFHERHGKEKHGDKKAACEFFLKQAESRLLWVVMEITLKNVLYKGSQTAREKIEKDAPLSAMAEQAYATFQENKQKELFSKRLQRLKDAAWERHCFEKARELAAEKYSKAIEDTTEAEVRQYICARELYLMADSRGKTRSENPEEYNADYIVFKEREQLAKPPKDFWTEDVYQAMFEYERTQHILKHAEMDPALEGIRPRPNTEIQILQAYGGLASQQKKLNYYAKRETEMLGSDRYATRPYEAKVELYIKHQVQKQFTEEIKNEDIARYKKQLRNETSKIVAWKVNHNKAFVNEIYEQFGKRGRLFDPSLKTMLEWCKSIVESDSVTLLIPEKCSKPVKDTIITQLQNAYPEGYWNAKIQQFRGYDAAGLLDNLKEYITASPESPIAKCPADHRSSDDLEQEPSTESVASDSPPGELVMGSYG